VFPVFCFFFFFRYEVYQWLLPDYRESVPIFVATLLGLPLRAYSFTTILQKLHKGRIINIGALADLVLALVLMYPMYRLMGLPGVALAFVITTYLQVAYYIYYIARFLHSPVSAFLPYINWLYKLIGFAMLFFAVHYLAVQYFVARNAVFLGAVVMAIAIAATLGYELKKGRTYGSTQA
jgi:hypothetical protein